MFGRFKIKTAFAFLLVCAILLSGVFAAARPVYAEPEGDAPARTQEVADDPQEDPNAQKVPQVTAPGIVVADDGEEEEEGNIMDSLLNADRQWLAVFNKVVTRLVIVLGILVVCVVILMIYIMATQTSRLSKQNKQMSRRPNKSVRTARPQGAEKQKTVRQVTEFGDTLRIRRTVVQNGAPNNVKRQGAANMQRPVAPQRPSRPQAGAQQPGARRPVQRPSMSQPQRTTPQFHQPQRPVHNAASATQPVHRSVPQPQPDMIESDDMWYEGE